MSCVVLYTKPACPLCDDARTLLDGLGHAYREEHDPAFDLRVPVVAVDGRIVSEGDPAGHAITRAVRRASKRV